MITTLSFYDFDGTLMDTPLPDEGKKVWLEKTGEEYPHIGWWGRPESIDLEVFDIKPFPIILDQLKTDTAKSDTYTVMLTSRLEKLKPAIQLILDKYNIVFDDLSLKNGGGEKSDRIKKYLQKFPDVETINIYDDRDKEMKVFSDLKKEIGDKYLINVYKVIDGNYALVESRSLIGIINEEITKYTEVKKSLKNSKNISSEMKELIEKYITSGTRYETGGRLYGLTMPEELKKKSKKTSGVSMGADKNGFFVYTHRARSKSYNKPDSIPVKDIDFIESTG